MNVMKQFIFRRGIGTRVLSPHANNFTDIPGPTPLPFIGSVLSYIPGIGKYDATRIVPCFYAKYKEFGPIFKERIFNHTLLYLVEPDDYQEVLKSRRGAEAWPSRSTHLVLDHVRTHELKDDHNNGGIFMSNGQEWADIRHTFQKSISFLEVGKFAQKGDELAMELISRLNDKSLKYHVDKDFLNIIFSYSADYMGMTLFGEKWNSIEHFLDKTSISSRLIHASTEINHGTQPTDHGAQSWRLFSTPIYKNILKCAQTLDEVAKERLESRMQDGKLVARSDDNLLDIWIQSGNQDYKQILTFISDMILAGIDTVAYSLSFIIYHLSVNAEAQKKLYQELLRLDPTMGEPMTPHLLGEASYMKKCIKEALRLNPLSVGVGRELTEDLILSGYHVPEGTSVVTLNQLTSRLPEYVEYPDSFIPERFNNDGKFKRIHPFVNLPFSHGPRSCVGRRMAEQNMNIFLFRLFRQYHVEWIGPKPLDCLTSIINMPDAPLLFRFTKRST